MSAAEPDVGVARAVPNGHTGDGVAEDEPRFHLSDPDDALDVVAPLISMLDTRYVVMTVYPAHSREAGTMAAIAGRALRADAEGDVASDRVAVVVLQTERNLVAARLRRAACAVQQEWRRRTSRPVWVGVAHAPLESGQGPARVAARAALDLGRVLWPNGRVVLEEDVWPYQPLLRDRRILDQFADLVEAVEGFDAVNGTKLLVSLEAFYEASLSQSATARRLGVHRHTVAARLDQIDTLLGRSVREGADRPLLEMAVKARRLRLWLETRDDRP